MRKPDCLNVHAFPVVSLESTEQDVSLQVEINTPNPDVFITKTVIYFSRTSYK